MRRRRLSHDASNRSGYGDGLHGKELRVLDDAGERVVDRQQVGHVVGQRPEAGGGGGLDVEDSVSTVSVAAGVGS